MQTSPLPNENFQRLHSNGCREIYTAMYYVWDFWNFGLQAQMALINI